MNPFITCLWDRLVDHSFEGSKTFRASTGWLESCVVETVNRSTTCGSLAGQPWDRPLLAVEGSIREYPKICRRKLQSFLDTAVEARILLLCILLVKSFTTVRFKLEENFSVHFSVGVAKHLQESLIFQGQGTFLFL